jgi:hypothetical protein
MVSDRNQLVKVGREVETSAPRLRLKPSWSRPRRGGQDKDMGVRRAMKQPTS